MNVKFSRYSLRLRASMEELDLLIKTGELSEQFMVPGGVSFYVSVEISNEQQMSLAHLSSDEIILKIPMASAQRLRSAKSKNDLHLSLSMPTNIVPYEIDFEIDAFQLNRKNKSEGVHI